MLSSMSIDEEREATVKSIHIVKEAEVLGNGDGSHTVENPCGLLC